MIMNRIIDKKAREGEFHFFNKEQLAEGFKNASFRDIQISSTYADQDFLVVASK